MSYQPYRQPISWLEHFLHLNLTVLTTGLWGLVWYYRVKQGRGVEPVSPLCRHCGVDGGRFTVRGINWVWVACDHRR